MIKQMIFCAATLAMLTTASCKKDKDPVFQTFESPISVQFTVPTVSNTSSEVSLSLNPLNYNVDSVIKANTNNNFDSKAVSSIYISQIEVTLPDADPNNNTANFESAKLLINSGSTPVIVGSANLPDTYAARATLQTSNNVNLKPYISGNHINFSMAGKARRVTTRPLQARLNATFRFEK